MPKKRKETTWDPNTKEWNTREVTEGDPNTNLSGMRSEVGSEVVDAAKRAKDRAQQPETKPDKEPDADPDDMTEEQYKTKYGPLVGASKWKNRSKKTSMISDSLGAPRA